MEQLDFNISTHSLTKRLTFIKQQPSFSGSISTHSLTKRLTGSEWSVVFGTEISTHSLTKRLTGTANGDTKITVFQLTASRRGWRSACLCQTSAVYISTHSLTKRLTFTIIEKFFWLIFQLTASRRGWRFKSLWSTVSFIFQLTASRRGWPVYNQHCYQSSYFNSQPHEEADGNSTIAHSIVNISTHSLTKRLTSAEFLHFYLQLTFQLTASRRGWRYYPATFPCGSYISTHSLTKRLTAILDKNTFI